MHLEDCMQTSRKILMLKSYERVITSFSFNIRASL